MFTCPLLMVLRVREIAGSGYTVGIEVGASLTDIRKKR